MSNDTAIISLKEKIDDLNQQAWEVRVTDLPKAFELSQESVKLARSINYPKGLAEGLRSLGFSYVRYSKNDEAAPLLKEALSLFQSLNDLKGQAVVYEYLGIVERNWGNLGASLDLLLKAYELVLQTGPLEVEITCSYQLGVTYKHLGNHENALDYLYRTLSLAKKINYPLMEAYATNIIGSIYFDNGNYNEALDCYQQGLIIRRQSHDKWGEAGSLDNIGFTYLKLNDLNKAIEYCKQSLAICQATEDKKGEANALLHLGEIYEQAGDIKQAAEFSNESLEIRKARGDKRGEIEVLLFLADLYKKRNDVEDHQIFLWLSGALRIADEIKAQDLLSKTYYDLHEYYQRKGNFKESLVHLEAHFQIEKELHKNSINQKIASLEISHRAEVISQRNKELTELNEKIEKANKEAQIQLALERVRARTMAMQHSDELKDAASLLFKQLEDLGVKSWSSGFNIWEDDGRSAIINMCNPDGSIATPYHLPHTEEIFFIRIHEARQRGDELLVIETGGKELEQTYNYMFSLPEVKKMLGGMEDTGFQIPKFQVSHCAFFSQGYLMFITYERVPEMWDVFKRLAKVFEQTYTRFLDLQKAEAQARESQIQLALERVRARTMAMHHSAELADTASELFQQIKELGFETWSCGFCIWAKNDVAEVWMAADSGGLLPPMMIPYKEEPTHSNIYEASLRGEPAYNRVWEGKELERHYAFLKTVPSVKEAIGVLERSGLSLPSKQCYYVGFFKQGYLLLITKEPNADLKELSKRFAKVFEQTYTRFLDLQKAEAQAREAQIEAALEKIRSRSLAMHKSDELKEVIAVVFEKLKELGLIFDGAGIQLFTEGSRDTVLWVAAPDHLSAPSLINLPYVKQDFEESELIRDFWKAKEAGENIYCKTYSYEEKNRYFNYVGQHNDFIKIPAHVREWQLQAPNYTATIAIEKNSALLVDSWSGQAVSPAEFNVIKRVARVFEQAYTRFLDLQKVEAQAKEAMIENALEKVRSRTMAMQRSDELQDAALLLFQQTQALGARYFACGFNIWDDDKKEATAWMAREDGIAPPFKTSSAEDVFFHIHEAAQRGESFFVAEQGGQVLETHYKYMASIPIFKSMMDKMAEAGLSVPSFQIIHCAFFSQGYLMFISFEPVPEAHDIFKRFAKVFEQTYTRFLDLQRAEAQARESQIEAALERVRSRTMGMQKSEELKDVIQVVFEQFVQLNIKIEHTGFVIDYKARDDYDIWIADPLGVPSRVIVPYFDSVYYNRFNEAKEKGEDFFATKLDFEEKNRFYQKLFEYVPGLPEEAKEFYFSCPGLAASTVLLENVCLYIENFAGIPYSDEENKTLMRFGKVFQQTYTRFKDLKLAEAHALQAEEDLVKLQTEKKRAEDALSELQVTQKQLIQAEKMASLGELTAGIAHEIQNPLNFVNNFSDVNKELLVEMKEEIERGNIEEVKLIANDIISNEEKINHHGKRADAIVKGMLQHSRSSSGVKEPTDINELADEYLRLAYHGLRAKDKSFNATMKTDFDEKIGKVNVIPQEIGRVFLNLITNAFYVVAEKKKQLANGYEPTVTVTTKKESDKVFVSVKDNGNGIPQKVLDKIFQPFFTTKPTGQGTGLGLSLSYDIVKAHSGEIKVKTKDGEGSEFIIQLPIGQ